MNDRQPRGRWKSVQYDYDALLALDDDESCLYCLSARDVMLILSSLDYFAWKTRYISPSNTPIDQETIDNWQGHLGERLMSCLAIRQDPSNPCLLQQQNDDGTWTTWANLRLCPPRLRIVGGVAVVELPDGTIVPSGGDEVFDGRDDPYVPPVRTDPPDDAICLASANAENVFYNMHLQVFTRVFVPDATWAALVLVTVIVGLLALAVTLAIIVSVIIAGGGVAILSGIDLEDYTDTVRRQFRCILVANATNTAGVVTFDFAAVQSAVASRIVGINIWAALNLYLSIVQESGLNRAGATTAIAEYDCALDHCGTWCYHFDDTSGFDTWTAESWPGTSFAPSWGGTAWNSGEAPPRVSYVWVSKTLTASEVFDAALHTSLGTTGSIWINGDGSLFSGTKIWESGTYIGGTYSGVVRIDLVVATVDAGMPAFTVDWCQFSGNDDNPFGDDNC